MHMHRPFCHVCNDGNIMNVSCLILWSAILEKCTENGQWPPVIFGSVHRDSSQPKHQAGLHVHSSVQNSGQSKAANQLLVVNAIIPFQERGWPDPTGTLYRKAGLCRSLPDLRK